MSLTVTARLCVCACDCLPGSLHMCKANLAGIQKPVFNLQSMCAVVMDQAKCTHLMTYSNTPGALVWSFSNDMAVTQCTLGSVALCLPVQLPVSSSGTHKYHLVVVLDLLNVADTLSWSSRRLLSATTSAHFEHIANGLVVPDHVDHAQAKEQRSINVAAAAAALCCNLTSSWVSHMLHLVVAHPQLVRALWSCSSLLPPAVLPNLLPNSALHCSRCIGCKRIGCPAPTHPRPPRRPPILPVPPSPAPVQLLGDSLKEQKRVQLQQQQSGGQLLDLSRRPGRRPLRAPDPEPAQGMNDHCFDHW